MCGILTGWKFIKLLHAGLLVLAGFESCCVSCNLQDMASFKIAALQKALDDSVPALELEFANKQYTELTEKYRDKLESTKSLVAFKEEASGYQVGM